jgi:hypothetical protein
LCSDELRALAIETGFRKRTSKLTPEAFFDLLFYAVSLTENSSLEFLVFHLEKRYNINICKQSLDERFSERAINFVKTVLSRLIREQFSELLFREEFLSSFHHVRIKDSTKFNIPSNLASHFKGNGGGGDISLAGICIQYEFDLKTGKYLDLTLTEGIGNDQTDAGETAENICKNDLIIRDLGYFSTSVLQKVSDSGAFFLSRMLSSTLVYDANKVEIDFQQLHSFMTKNGIEQFEKQVFIGKEQQLPVRLVIGLVPPELYEERLRRKQKEEKRRGCQMKERTKLLLHFNLFVTNVEAKDIPVEKIMPLYRFRWQVELAFKNWKSVFSIHKFQKMKYERYVTMLYTRLILIVVNMQIINRVQSALSKQGRTDIVLSYRKTLQSLKNSFIDIWEIVRCTREKATKLLGKIYHLLSKNHWREKRKKRVNFIENIYLFICKPEK